MHLAVAARTQTRKRCALLLVSGADEVNRHEPPAVCPCLVLPAFKRIHHLQQQNKFFGENFGV